MSIGKFIYDSLNGIAETYPAPAPAETALPFITYGIDGQEVIGIMGSGSDIIKNFVTITVYDDEYDKVATLYESIKVALNCSVDEVQGIMGVNYASMSTGFDGEPLDRHSVTLEISIYER